MRARPSRSVAKIRRATQLPLWVKLTPNTGDVAAVARAAEDAGADALVVANTILAMSIDVETFHPRLGNIMGGLSGPAVKPIIVRMTYQCAKAVRIPVIGCGGIATAEDAVEYMLAGATAVQVGTATFVRPMSMIDVIDGLVAFCRRKGFARVADLTGAVRDSRPESRVRTCSRPYHERRRRSSLARTGARCAISPRRCSTNCMRARFDGSGITRECYDEGENAAMALYRETAERNGLRPRGSIRAANLIVSLPGGRRQPSRRWCSPPTPTRCRRAATSTAPLASLSALLCLVRLQREGVAHALSGAGDGAARRGKRLLRPCQYRLAHAVRHAPSARPRRQAPRDSGRTLRETLARAGIDVDAVARGETLIDPSRGSRLSRTAHRAGSGDDRAQISDRGGHRHPRQPAPPQHRLPRRGRPFRDGAAMAAARRGVRRRRSADAARRALEPPAGTRPRSRHDHRRHRHRPGTACA